MTSFSKKIVVCTVLLSLTFLAVPYFISRVLEPNASNAPVVIEPVLVTPRATSQIQLKTYARPYPYLDELCPFERYLVGVVAAEVPALFHMEALRAQAVAARTYAIYSMSALEMYKFDHGRISEIWQAYLTEAEMRRRWGHDFDSHFGTIWEAVASTRGEVLVYDDEPILAVYHAFSGGQTEYSENVWSAPRPYLRSVNSDFYTYRADFEYTHEFSNSEFVSLLRSVFPNIELESSNIAAQIIINERSAAGYIQRITIGNQTMDATQLRNILGLRSTNFTITQNSDSIAFRTRGHGHGVGMSQVGANALARRGYSYIEILKHYFSGALLVGGF